MGERLKRAWVAYKKYKLVMRIIAAFVGIIVGISGCIAFAKVYHNYNAASWAGVSALFAALFLHLHFAVRRDLERVISREKFTTIMYVGFGGLVSGIIGFIINIAFGIKNHESGVNVEGNFIVCVWNFMTFKWGLFTFLAARKFRKIYFETDPQNRGLIQQA
ncbi:hypothetical protein ACROYT_G024259 [Oculina patagonica]